MELKDKIYEMLKKIQYPGFSRDLVSFGMVKEVHTSLEGNVDIVLDVRTKDDTVLQTILNTVKTKVAELPQVRNINVLIEGTQKAGSSMAQKPQSDKTFLPDVKYKIAVASGKGGVGKSTVSVNLAAALAKTGLKVGLLDADIYGPSIPLMLGITERPAFDGKKLLPIEKYGLKLMSLGFLLTEDSPVIWRGPLVMRAIQQLMRDVDWGTLDIIVFDMPPGTGDAQLTLSQSVTLDGAVIVSTPQDVALLDAVKGVQMFQKVNVPILGIVENMSYFDCPHCHQRSDIFSSGGARRECERLNVELLGEIPLDMEIREGGDAGIPVVHKNPDNPHTRIFQEIAEKIIKKLA